MGYAAPMTNPVPDVSVSGLTGSDGRALVIDNTGPQPVVRDADGQAYQLVVTAESEVIPGPITVFGEVAEACKRAIAADSPPGCAALAQQIIAILARVPMLAEMAKLP
jgi:hypothetical protein